MSGQTPKREYRPAVKVKDFLEAGEKSLRIELVAGAAGLGHRIRETTLNRPGLALSGFLSHFPRRRIQVLGLAECEYLNSLAEEDRRQRLSVFFATGIPCVVVTRRRKISKDVKELAERSRVPLLRSAMITKHFINAATILMENLSAPRANVQGTMVEIMGIGVLIEGKPGMGKSEIALALIKKGHALVADDVTRLRLDSAGYIVCSAVDVTRYHMEIRGLGIIHVPSLFGVASIRGEKRLDLVVTLCEPKEVALLSGDHRSGVWEIFGVQIPRIFLPVAPGRDLANVVEAAALDQKLKALGHDAEKELDERLIATMSMLRNGSE